MLDLTGHAVLVTRPLPQARGMAALVTAAGGTAIVQPAIDIVPAPDDEESLQCLAKLDAFDAAIFTSPNAVQETLARAPRNRWPTTMKLYAVGPSTRRALLQRGFPEVQAPPEEVGAMALEPVILATPGHRRAVMFAARGGRMELAEALGKAGIDVTWCYAYQRRPAALQPGIERNVRARWGTLIVIATSAIALKSIAGMLEKITSRPLIVPSARLRDVARELGYAIVAVSERPSDRSMLEATRRFIERRK